MISHYARTGGISTRRSALYLCLSGLLATTMLASPAAAYTVTFLVSGPGQLQGDTVQTVPPGGDCTPVRAVADGGNQFFCWSGTGGFANTRLNPLTIQNVSADMTLTASFGANPGPINVLTEPGGDVVLIGQESPLNTSGALFYVDGRWGVNSTYGHMYFTYPNVCPGAKVLAHQPLAIPCDGTTGPLYADYGFQVHARQYRYSIAADQSGERGYIYYAIEYEIEDPAGWLVILRSRGSGHGTENAHFNVYLGHPDADRTTGFLGDPVWCVFETDPYTAADLSVDESEIWGDMPTGEPAQRAQYWLDVDGGSDMGGRSFHLITAGPPLTGVATAHLGSSLITSFDIQFASAPSGDPDRVIVELTLEPFVIREERSIYLDLARYLAEISPLPAGLDGDLNGDGRIDAADLVLGK